MALITWEEILARSSSQPAGSIFSNQVEAKKAFDYYIKQPRWKAMDKATQLSLIANNINLQLRANKGMFIVPAKGHRWTGMDTKFKWDAFVKENPTFPESFKTYLAKVRVPRLKEIAKKNISLKEKYNLLTTPEKKSARLSMKWQKPYEGLIPVKEFVPFTNFKHSTVMGYLNQGKKDLPKPTTKNAQLIYLITSIF